MDSLSSSFLSKLPLPRNPLVSPPPHFSIFSVRIEDNPIPAITKPPGATAKPPLKKEQTNPVPRDPAPGNSRTSFGRSLPELSLPATVFNVLDQIIDTFIDPPLRPSVDPRYVLADNFAPVNELPPTECCVVGGPLPPSLNGAYIRNGPNPQYLPRGPYHLFDGDGMLHALRISGGRASLCSRFVNTHKYASERSAGQPLLPNVFSGFNGLTASAARGIVNAGRFLTGQFDPGNGIGNANASLTFFGGKLYALGESDLPYALKVHPNGEITTLGRENFDGKLVMRMTAHPKIDPDTNEVFAFRCGPMPPFLTFFWFDPEGKKQPDVPIFSMTSPSFLHDFAITKRYAIFTEIQLEMNPMELIAGGSPVAVNKGKVPRIGIIPRYAKNEGKMRWLEVPGFNTVHAINAWDEGEEEVVLVAPNILSVEHTLERMDLIHACVEKVRINLRTGVVSRHPLSTRNLDFAVVNPAYVAKRNRYVYAAVYVTDPMPKVTGVVKLDISVSDGDRRDCIVGSHMYGPGCYGGEPFFVAQDPDDPNAEEDDGYVVSYGHNETTGESRFLVMDAKTPDLKIVSEVKLPRRVPYGFHGLFVREKDLDRI